MQTKNLTRDVRRHYRSRAIQHAFDIYWHQWYGFGAADAYDYNKWQHDKVFPEDNAARFQHEDEHRQEVLSYARKNAKHLCNCSCFMCSGHKKYEKTPKQLRLDAQDADELDALFCEEILEEGMGVKPKTLSRSLRFPGEPNLGPDYPPIVSGLKRISI